MGRLSSAPMRPILLLLCATLVLHSQNTPRDWKIYVITHTHADIGYTGLIPEVERVWCQGMDQAIIAAEGPQVDARRLAALRRLHPPSHSRKGRPTGAVDQGRKDRDRQSLHQHRAGEYGPEELVRSTFFANERLLRQYGIQSKTAMLSDITGITWGLPRALAGSGTRYLLYGPGTYKELLGESTLPHLFYYQSQDGSRVLMQLRTGKYRHYSSATFSSTQPQWKKALRSSSSLTKPSSEVPLRRHPAAGRVRQRQSASGARRQHQAVEFETRAAGSVHGDAVRVLPLHRR